MCVCMKRSEDNLEESALFPQCGSQEPDTSAHSPASLVPALMLQLLQDIVMHSENSYTQGRVYYTQAQSTERGMVLLVGEPKQGFN